MYVCIACLVWFAVAAGAGFSTGCIILQTLLQFKQQMPKTTTASITTSTPAG